NFHFNPAYPHWVFDPLNTPSTNPPARPPALYGAEGNVKTLICPSTPDPASDTWVIIDSLGGFPNQDFNGNAFPPAYYPPPNDVQYFFDGPTAVTAAYGKSSYV